MTINFHDSLWAVFFNKQKEKSDFFLFCFMDNLTPSKMQEKWKGEQEAKEVTSSLQLMASILSSSPISYQKL